MWGCHERTDRTATRVKIRITQELYQDIQNFRYTTWLILPMQACKSTFKGRKTSERITAFALTALIFPKAKKLFKDFFLEV